MNIFTIPAHQNFLPVLIKGVEARYDIREPLSLAQMQIFLPTRRAVLQLRSEFLVLHANEALLLPRIAALGDIDLNADAGFLFEDPFIAPAINPVHRQVKLAKLIMAHEKMHYDHALHLAFALARLLDEMQAEKAEWSSLDQLVPEEFAEHWGVTLKLLEILSEEWPKSLQREQRLDPIARRSALIEKQLELWRKIPPSHPVIVAGATGDLPDIANLMRAVAGLPQGSVILPGLDQALDPESWQDMTDPHPQAAMKHWLEQTRIARAEVQSWHHEKTTQDENEKIWRSVLKPSLGDAKEKFDLRGLTVVEAANEQEESEIIALKIREVLEDKNRTAMIVTPDRGLAARIRTALTRYAIALDDSAGFPLSESALGSFFDLTARIAQEKCDAVTLLAFLKHPLTALGMEPAKVRLHARTLEMQILRGPRRDEGIKDYALVARKKEHHDLAAFLDHLVAQLEEWRGAIAGTRSLPEWLETHVRFAEKIAAAGDENGGVRLWRGDDGDAAAQLFRTLLETDKEMLLSFDDYHTVLLDFMRRAKVRARFGTHPRVRLLSPVESRLQHADVVILAGLNEGTWPEEESADPWLSRSMRRQVGLSVHEKKVSAGAHDFVQCAARENIFLTRSVKNGGAPAVRSRWLEKLFVALDAAGRWHEVDRTACWQGWVAALDAADKITPVRQPRVMPPVAARPRKLSVSDVELWRRDPYSLYAKKILQLKQLDQLDEDPDARTYGNIVHKALERFFRHFDQDHSVAALQRLGEEELAGAVPPGHPLLTFWREKFSRLCAWMEPEIATLVNNRVQIAGIECAGAMTLPAAHAPFEIYGKADRIDRQRDGSLMIVDYKTGSKPTKKERDLGYASQLALLALIANKGGFPGIEALPVAAVDYWDFAARPKNHSVDLGTHQAGLMQWIDRFDQDATPYVSTPHAAFAPRFTRQWGDYAHLARRREWSLETEEEPDDTLLSDEGAE